MRMNNAGTNTVGQHHEKPLLTKWCNMLVKDAEPGVPLPDGTKAVIDAARAVCGGLWVGGRIRLFEDRIEFTPTSLNVALHEGDMHVTVPLATVRSVRRRFGFVSGIVVLQLQSGEIRLRCFGAKAAALTIERTAEAARA